MAAAIRRLYDPIWERWAPARNRVRYSDSPGRTLLNIQLANYAGVLTGGGALPEFGAGAEVGS